MPKTSNKRSPPNPTISIVWLAVILLMLFFLFNDGEPRPQAQDTISYSEFVQQLDLGNLRKVALEGQILYGELIQQAAIGAEKRHISRFKTHLPPFGGEQLQQRMLENNVEINVLPVGAGWVNILLPLLPWVIFIGIWFWLIQRSYRNITGGSLGPQSELKKLLDPAGSDTPLEIPDFRFSDVAGQDSAKQEVAELVQYLRAPEKFRRMGAEVPRGVLLMGPPGTGKTLLAKALAGEAGVPFASISASEFIEVFVGVGAARVRKLFATAKLKAPSIIFIDELDSVGRTRGTGLGGGHDEREQTLNQILAEMDGFTGHESVIILAATNRPDVLDPALLRPGRFDRHVTLDLPDRDDRIKILQVHTLKVPIAADVDLKVIANGTPGFSGADLKNLVNEAAIFAIREDATQVQMGHFDQARDKLLVGTVRTLAIQPAEKHRLAVHEAGHTLVAYFLPNADPIYKVTIIPRGHALGGTYQLPEQERHTYPEEYLRDKLAVMLAGRCAENHLLHSISSGADDDIMRATSLARSMVTRWGMAKEIGPMDLRQSSEHPFLGKDIAQPRHFSENSAQLVDKAVKQILLDAEQSALQVLTSRETQLQTLVAALQQQETLSREHIERCLTDSEPSHRPSGAIHTDT